MKYIFTILLVFIVSAILAQQKDSTGQTYRPEHIDTIKYKAFNWEYTPPLPDGRMIDIYPTPRTDTIKVWYHEVKELAGWVVERWTQGYKVIHSDYTIFNSLDNADYYL